MIKLTKNQVLMLHQDLIEAYGGDAGIRDESLLEKTGDGSLSLFIFGMIKCIE